MSSALLFPRNNNFLFLLKLYFYCYYTKPTYLARFIQRYFDIFSCLVQENLAIDISGTNAKMPNFLQFMV